MKASELHDKTPDQLRDALVNLKKEAFNLRFQQATGQLENPARLRNVKRDVARVKTVLTQKAAGAVSDGTSAGKSSDGTSAGKSSDSTSAGKTSDGMSAGKTSDVTSADKTKTEA